MINTNFLSEARKFFQCEYLIPVGSGTAGLFLALKTIDVRHKKVMIPGLTCPNVALAVIAAGGTPVVVDVSHHDANISVAAIEQALDRTIRAIIAVDSFGYPANISALKKLAASFDILVIEDACQAYGGKIAGEVIGSRGDLGVISFGYSKPVALLGGGFLMTHSQDMFKNLTDVMASWNVNVWAVAKNRIALKLGMKNQYKIFGFLSLYLGLLRYGFPASLWKDLPEAWRRFENELEPVKSQLKKTQEFISRFRGFERFDYKEENWLPWRYSFKLPQVLDRTLFANLAREIGLGYSRLYPPLTYQFQELECLTDEKSAANRISSAIINLKYEMNLRSIRSLVDKVSLLYKRW